MTISVCLTCGELKRGGAFNRCRKCGSSPDDDESMTKQLIVTDHYFPIKQLEEIAGRVKRGEPVTFNEQTMRDIWVNKADFDADVQRFQRKFSIASGIVIALGLCILGALLWAATSR